MRKDLRNSELYEEIYRFEERRSNVRFFTLLLVLAALVLGLRMYWVNSFGGVQVDGASMNRTLYHGEQLIMRYTENGKGAKRGDVIVVNVENYPEVQRENAGKAEEEKLRYLIKRLIAVEGDSVKCVDGQIYLQKAGEDEFEPLDEPYAYYRSEKDKQDYDFETYELGEGEIFFLGDNRCNSLDSRYKENSSHLKNRLYKAEDIFGVVPSWAIEYQQLLGKIFF